MASNSVEPLLLDTSAAVALVVSDHEAHTVVSTRVKGRQLGLAGHAAFETFSVLTRQPPPRRLSPMLAGAVIRQNFPLSHHLSADASAALVDELAGARISGGSVFDALVAAAAREAGRTLISRDRRAAAVYLAIGADVEFL